ncbi:MAG: hypothetical protein ABJO78_19505, partial [Ascidiaceihabitans sp.]
MFGSKAGLRGTTALVCVAMVLSSGAIAADLTWDSDPVTGGVQLGAGNWDTTTNNWRTTGVGPVQSTFTDGDSVTFRNPGGATTINVTSIVNPLSITINGDYIFSNSTIVGGAGTALALNFGATVVINNELTGLFNVTGGSGTSLTLSAN